MMTAAPHRVQRESATALGLEVVLANFLLVVLLFPYVSPVPMQTDVQPFGIVIALGCLLILFVVRGYVWHLDRVDVLLLAVAFLYALYTDWTTQRFDLQFLRKNAVLILVFPAYWAVKQLYARMASATVLAVAWLYLGITLVQALAPAVFRSFAGLLLPRLVEESAARGLTGPCPEPSFLAYIALAFPLVFKLIAAKEQNVGSARERRRFITVLVISVVLVLLSKSVTGVVFGAVLLVVVWLFFAGIPLFVRLALVGLALAFLGSVGVQMAGTRAGHVLRLIVTNPALVLRDASIASRYVQVLAGPYTALTNPLGTGTSVGDPEVFETAAAALGFDRYVPQSSMEYIRRNRTPTGSIAVLSPVGDSLARMGLVFVAVFIAVIAVMRYPPLQVTSRVFFTLGVISSFPLAFPIFWLILGAHEGWYSLHRLPSLNGVDAWGREVRHA